MANRVRGICDKKKALSGQYYNFRSPYKLPYHKKRNLFLWIGFRFFTDWKSVAAHFLYPCPLLLNHC